MSTSRLYFTNIIYIYFVTRYFLRQRQGGSADDGDLKPKKKAGLFDFLKKKEPEPEPEAPKKQNPWTF